MDLFCKTMKPVKQVLENANLKKEESDKVSVIRACTSILLTEVVDCPCSTRIPKAQRLLKGYFSKKPSKGVDPDKAVAYGATVPVVFSPVATLTPSSSSASPLSLETSHPFSRE